MDKAEALRALHAGPGPLVLPNAWDAASAVVFERAGARAIGTTSVGIANALGYSDGEAWLPPDEMLWVVGHIARAVDLPVTADVEGGYGDVAVTAAAALAAGAVGLNVEDHVGDEDGVIPIAQAVDAVHAVHEAGERHGVPVVVNARTDTLVRGGTVADAIERGTAYLAAGADCVFVVGARERAEIGELVRRIPGPVNVLASPGGLTVAELTDLGVRRISIGGAAFAAATAGVARLAADLLGAGTMVPADNRDDLPDFNAVFRARAAGIAVP